MAKKRTRTDRRKHGSGVAFMTLDAEEVAALRTQALALARSQQDAFPQLIDRLLALMREVYPPHVIAVMAGWGLRGSVGAEGVSARSMIPGLEQHHVELFQALALTLRWDEWGREPAEMQQIQLAIDTTRALADAFFGRRLLATEVPLAPAAAALLALQERMRLHTQMVRNWGYYSDVLRICRGLYAPLDGAFRTHHGYSASDMISVIDAIVHVVDSQVQARHKTLRTIFRARSVRQLVRLFFERYPGVAGDPQAFLASLPANEPIQSVKLRLLSYADRWLTVCAVAPVAAVAERAGVEISIATAVMDRLSFEPGALVASESEHLFLANPVWMRPGIKTHTEYFFAFPQTAGSFIHHTLKAALEEAGLAEALADRRAAYLEGEVARLLAVALPRATIAEGVKWRWGDQGFETDVLAVIDRTVVIAEAKSGTLTPQALRGAPDRVRKHLQELVVEASDQSARLEAIIGQAKGGDSAAKAVVSSLGLDAALIDTVVRLTVTLDDFSVLCSAEGELKGAGLVAADVDLAPTLNVADFACATDLLSPIHFLHYFSERRRFQKRVNLMADELDLLGMYLETNFNLNGQPEVQDVALSGMSAALDSYYVSRDAGVVLAKPAPRPGLVFAAILAELEQSRPAAWTTAGVDLLRSASHDEQRQLKRSLEGLRGSVPKTFRDPEHQNALIWTPPDEEAAVVLFYVFPQANRATRRKAVEQLSAQALDVSGRARCVIIGRMVEDWTRAYHFVGVAYADGSPP